jgi:hypothetical protein
MAYTYTDEQINAVMNIGYDMMKHATSEVQNCTFPNAAIKAAMLAGKSPQEVADAAYESIISLEPMRDGYRLVDTYNSVAHPFHNAAMFMVGEITKKLNEFVTT